MGAAHLAGRFIGSLRPGGPRAVDRDWVEATLRSGELDLWRRMSAADRRHSVGVARRVEAALDDGATPPVLAAALLHDVGKLEADLGVYGRVIATLSAAVAGREQADTWSQTRGFTRRVGLYLLHPRIGSEMLALAGSDELTVAWAREHHRPEDEWSVPAAIGRILKDADDD